jgi:hypothetical protein
MPMSNKTKLQNGVDNLNHSDKIKQEYTHLYNQLQIYNSGLVGVSMFMILYINHLIRK